MTGTPLLLFAAVLLVGFATVSRPADPKAAESVAELIAQLGDRDYARRQQAEAALVARGEGAMADLRAAANTSPVPEIRWRARRAWGKVVRTIAGVSKSTGLKLALVIPAEFRMGSPPREYGRRLDELSHAVRLSNLYLIGECEVTQEEYKAITGDEPSWFSPTGRGKEQVAGRKTDRFPVETVTWFDAVAFCNALSKKDGYKPYYEMADVKRENGAIVAAAVKQLGGNGYRLPTEAEWEFACRAGTGTAYHFGTTVRGGEGNFKALVNTGGYGGAEEKPSRGHATAVGEYKANALGLSDMHGNVAEWCEDWNDALYYQKSPVEDPTGPETGTHKAVRGGSWLVTNTSCRSASRGGLKPGERDYATGFRVARTP